MRSWGLSMSGRTAEQTVGTGLGFHLGPLENLLPLSIPRVSARPQQVSMLRFPVMGAVDLDSM